jgi:hypothetical protein
MTINDSAIRTSNLSPSGPSVQARARDGARTFRDHEGIPSPERRKGFVITQKEGMSRAEVGTEGPGDYIRRAASSATGDRSPRVSRT